MNPFDDLIPILTRRDLTQAQREALVDLVVWAMYVDGTIKHEENEQLDAVIRQLSTAAPIPLDRYLYTAIATIRDAWHDPARSERILAHIDTRLATPEIRHTAYALCQAVTQADGELATTEASFLERVRRQFGLENT